MAPCSPPPARSPTAPLPQLGCQHAGMRVWTLQRCAAQTSMLCTHKPPPACPLCCPAAGRDEPLEVNGLKRHRATAAAAAAKSVSSKCTAFILLASSACLVVPFLLGCQPCAAGMGWTRMNQQQHTRPQRGPGTHVIARPLCRRLDQLPASVHHLARGVSGLTQGGGPCCILAESKGKYKYVITASRAQLTVCLPACCCLGIQGALEEPWHGMGRETMRVGQRHSPQGEGVAWLVLCATSVITASVQTCNM